MKQHDLPFFFIVGKGRSGTTLLQQLLDAHPEIIVPPESTFIIHLFSKYNAIKWNEKTLAKFVEDLYNFRLFTRDWNIDKTKLYNQLLKVYQAEKNFTYAKAIQVVYLAYPSPYPKKKIVLLGDKNPFYSFYLKTLKELFPSSKFIHLVRDPRANVYSHLKAFRAKNIGFIAYKWLAYNQEIEHEKKKNPSQFFTLKHEKLTENPSESLKEISAFLGVEYYEKSLQYKSLAATGTWDKKNFKEGIHQRIMAPISASVNQQYKSFFTQKQVCLIEYITARLAFKYGYNIQQKSQASFSLKLGFQLASVRFYAWLTFVKLFYSFPFFIKKIVFRLLSKRTR